MSKPVVKSEEAWRESLDELSFRVLREGGTERPHSSELNAEWRDGVYLCKGCGTALFTAESKFNAGCGWPSFDRELEGAAIRRVLDRSHGMVRVELRCSGCDGHLGHVFPDGPTATGERYCINGTCLTFNPDSGD